MLVLFDVMLNPGSLHTREGIAKFSNKDPSQITDQDAVNCLINFFNNNFEKFGKFYSTPSNNKSVFNFPIKQFFTKESLAAFNKLLVPRTLTL